MLEQYNVVQVHVVPSDDEMSMVKIMVVGVVVTLTML